MNALIRWGTPINKLKSLYERHINFSPSGSQYYKGNIRKQENLGREKGLDEKNSQWKSEKETGGTFYYTHHKIAHGLFK